MGKKIIIEMTDEFYAELLLDKDRYPLEMYKTWILMQFIYDGETEIKIEEDIEKIECDE